MAVQGLLDTYPGLSVTRKASEALIAHRCVTLDISTDETGGTVMLSDALTEKPFGVVLDSCAIGDIVGVVIGGVVPITCVDASIDPDTLVYNDVDGKVTSTKGTGSFQVGITVGATNAANQLVSVKLNIGLAAA